MLLIGTAPAGAVDGCKVLLCLVGPWQGIPACVPPVEQLFADLWNGYPFPTCSFGSGAVYAPALPGTAAASSGSASNVWILTRADSADPNGPA
jgi:hypothetical protein